MKRLTTLFLALLITFVGFGQRVLEYEGKVLTYDSVTVHTGFCSEYQAVYDAYDLKPAADTAMRQDKMVRDLITYGIWAKLDVLYILSNNTWANSLINWINPGTFDLIPVNLVAGDFTAYRGWTGDGISKYLRTQYNPTLHAINYAQNNASIGHYTRTDANGLHSDFGGSAADRAYILGRNGGTAFLTLNDGVASGFGATPNSIGFYIGNRIVAANRSLYKNSALIATVAMASTGIPNMEFTFLSRGIPPSALSPRQIACGFVGGGLDEAGNSEVTNFTNAIETYMDYIGAGVISECLWLIILLIPNIRRKEEEFKMAA